MNVKTYIKNVNIQVGENFEKALDEEEFEIAEIVQLIDCYKKRAKSLNKSELIDEVVYDLFTAIYLAISGLYKHSFISLRCALELGISLIKFYDDNYSYLLWKSNQEDISWSNLCDYEKGVLSKKYLSLFYEGNFQVFIQSTKECYRECSEYVHGKYKYINDLNEYRISYDKDICAENLSMCKKVARILSVLICIRFENKVDQYYELLQECIKSYEV